MDRIEQQTSQHKKKLPKIIVAMVLMGISYLVVKTLNFKEQEMQNATYVVGAIVMIFGITLLWDALSPSKQDQDFVEEEEEDDVIEKKEMVRQLEPTTHTNPTVHVAGAENSKLKPGEKSPSVSA